MFKNQNWILSILHKCTIEKFNKALIIQGGIVLPLRETATGLVPLVSSDRENPNFIVSAVVDSEGVPEYYARFSRHEESKVVIRFQTE